MTSTAATQATAFARAVSTKDWELLRETLTPDVRWSFPGENRLSGVAVGYDAVIAQIELIRAYGVSIELEYVLHGRETVALQLHNTARRGDLVLDEHLSTVCTLRDGRIATADTHLSDLDMMNAFFVDLD
jgi:ketosteroid isomerase-like protein